MRKPLVLTMLILLSFLAATAQQKFPVRKLYPDPSRPGRLIDASQLRLIQLQQRFITSELTRIKDSLNVVRINGKLSPNPINNTRSTINDNSVNGQRSSVNDNSVNGQRSSVNDKILTNSCGTKASFTPANDTTLYTGQSIDFINTSQNADSYEWIQDTYFKTTPTDFTNFTPPIGVTPIQLVAHRGNCTDTAITYIIRNGTPPTDQRRLNVSYGLPNTSEWASSLVNAKTDGYLLAGLSGVYDQASYTNPYFVRVSETGCILWSKLLTDMQRTILTSLTATYDSGFVVQVVLRDYIDRSYLLKLDKNGNILWTKNYQGANSLTYITNIKEMPDHSLMLLSGQWSGKNFLLTSVSEQGNFNWQKKYAINESDQASFTGIAEKNGFAYISGTYYQLIDAPTNQWHEFPMLFKVDASNGNYIWSKGYSSPNKFFTNSGIQLFKDGLIMNCIADSLLDFANNKWGNYQSLLETDLDGNVLDAKLFYMPNGMDQGSLSDMIVSPDNSMEILFTGGDFTNLQPLFLPWNYIFRLDADKNILWQEEYSGYGFGNLVKATPSPDKGIAMIGQRVSTLLNPTYGLAFNLNMIKLDSNGKAPDQYCGLYASGVSLQDLEVNDFSPGLVNETNENLQVMTYPLAETSANSELRYFCPDYVPFCSFMKISGKRSVCNLKDTLDFVAHKDPNCGDPVKWTYDVTNIKTVFEDGNKTRLIFKTPGTYIIRAEKPFPCTSITDSIVVTVAPSLINFNLGADTTLCNGDSLVLRIPGNYFLYQWQDLSALDSFKVKTSGTYYCMVTDTCGNTKSDTIKVDFRGSIPLDLGPDLTLCPGDSATIYTPAGFKDYLWVPFYNFIGSAGGTATFFPAKDTSYRLTVHDNLGCVGTDELKIHVLPVTTVNLGNDTAVCTGAHVVFSADAGYFQSYVWSNGTTDASIDVNMPGKYMVQVKDQNLCKFYDTVVLTNYPLPIVKIKGGTVLCKDQELLLDAGAGFSNYVWQDGSVQEKFRVTDTGYYKVQVTDLHRCFSSDSIHIATYAESPQGFLSPDTTVCLYQGGIIGPKSDYSTYNWSTGETSKTIQVKTAGLFSLQVTDLSGCRGMESIQVNTKDCEALLVFPNAFTPNHDGKNDVFRLKYPGMVNEYKLQIFSRWGQLVYSSTDPFGGWDGDFKGEHQPDGTYVWIAHFTDRDGKKQTIQGSVVVIR